MPNDFKINGTSLTHQPSEHRWKERDPLGLTGDGKPLYDAFHEYELEWDFLNPTEYNEIFTYYSAIGITGSAVVSLPRYAFATYTFFAYSGCLLSEPTYENYFEEYYQGVRLLITRIRV